MTSRAHTRDRRQIDEKEHERGKVPYYKNKNVVVITARVHPGETNSSFIIEGFIRFITSSHYVAQELRKRMVFKIVPMLNPDGVIGGNYRTSLSGNDLNRVYHNPHKKLHPTICAVLKIIQEERDKAGSGPGIFTYIDIHGHSKKKNLFLYGPEFPIHDTRYLKVRIIPKLMSIKSDMFRFYSCKFRVTEDKEKTARVVLWRKYGI